MTTPLTCSHCGTALPVAARFCPGCAQPVAAGPPAVAPATAPRSWAWPVFAVACLLAVSCGLAGKLDIGNLPLQGAADATRIAAAPAPTRAIPSRDLSGVLHLSPHPTILTEGTTARAQTIITNLDSVPHTVSVQANFYRVPVANLGSDPAQYLVTAGTVPLVLAAREERGIEVVARWASGEPIAGVDFRTIGY